MTTHTIIPALRRLKWEAHESVSGKMTIATTAQNMRMHALFTLKTTQFGA